MIAVALHFLAKNASFYSIEVLSELNKFTQT